MNEVSLTNNMDFNADAFPTLLSSVKDTEKCLVLKLV